MTEGREGAEPVGSLSEEAARLAEALHGWAQAQGAPLDAMRDHIATGSAECRLCPVCRLIARVREAGPDAYVHLMDAASSLLMAVRAFSDDGKPRGSEPADHEPRGRERSGDERSGDEPRAGAQRPAGRGAAGASARGWDRRTEFQHIEIDEECGWD